jgi:hypothetical protein
MGQYAPVLAFTYEQKKLVLSFMNIDPQELWPETSFSMS